MTRQGNSLIVALAILGATLVANPAQAQRMGGFGRIGGFTANPAGLLLIEQVQKEIELADEQKEKLSGIGEKFRAETRELISGLEDLEPEQRRAKREELRPKLEELTKKMRQEAEAVLLPDQLTRLQGIYIQVAGAQALSDEAIVKALGITPEQQKQLEAISADLEKKRRELFQGMRDLDREQRQEKMAQVQEDLRKAAAEAQEKALAVLTEEQKEKLEGMKGGKFELDPSQTRPRRRG